MKYKLITEAVPAKCQHKTPCPNCPWTRRSLPGWLGGATPETWVQRAHGETMVECHLLTGAQCAGLAVYRANVVKNPRDRDILRLPANRETVFATPTEFLEHHKEPS